MGNWQNKDEPNKNKQKKSFVIKINYEGKTSSLKLYEDLKIEDIIKKFVNDSHDSQNFILKVNGRECFLRKKISYYEEEIKDNIIFYLIDKNDFKDENGNENENENENGNENKIENGNENGNENKIENGNENENENKIENKIENKNDNIAINDDYDDFEEEDIDYDNIVIDKKNIKREGYVEDNSFNMVINIEFFKVGDNNFDDNNNKELKGLLKLCLLKKISQTDEFKIEYKNKNINNLPKKIIDIITILQKGKIDYNNVQEGILRILEKIKGGNIINFSRYVDELISQEEINNCLISKLNNSKDEINYIHNCLGKYIEYVEMFEKEFERAKKNSVFEFSIISVGIIERKDLNKFEESRKNCDNRIDRVLFHGTSHDSISKILPGAFRRSTKSAQHGRGVYFTEDLDSCWIYGSEKNLSAENKYRNLDIPKVGEFLTFIASAIYYNKDGFKRVYDYKYTPKKNEINFAFAGMNKLETIEKEKPDQSIFFGTEFVINELEQICPFMSFKLKRDEYCIIWRDNNFSQNPVYNNKFDGIFKQFLKGRMNYINKMAKFNIYPCETSEEALTLIKRKKYNKIILISNIGTDLGGKKFVEEARKIINSDIVVLFNAFSIDHLKWVKDFPNALFSNEPKFYEQYLSCFYNNNEKECKKEIINLKENIEQFYNVKFNFNKKFLDYPYARDPKIKQYKDLTF